MRSKDNKIKNWVKLKVLVQQIHVQIKMYNNFSNIQYLNNRKF
jgi:hypothetical protein